uniref:Putative salivary kunitz domain protein n=1 Tax=Ixodes ricinus TaxID=34613 RepID=A0A0K8RDN1_IXORI
MKLLLIAVVISIHTTGFLTTAEASCEPLYNGGRGGAGGRNVQQKWSFNPSTKHCQAVMVQSNCRTSENCFHTENECEEYCDPTTQLLKKELEN